jgi:hypothetical protein
LRNRAYQIWNASGVPHDRDLEHWLEAVRELEADDDGTHVAKKEAAGGGSGEGLSPRRLSVRQARKVDAKAQEAKHAIEGTEASELKRAETIDKSRSRGRAEKFICFLSEVLSMRLELGRRLEIK